MSTKGILSINNNRAKLIIFSLYLSSLILLASWSSIIQSKPQYGKPPPVPVKTVKAKKIAWHQTIRGIGTLVASQSVMLKAGTTGHITHIYFQEGTYVKENALLIELDHAVLSAMLAEAKAQAQLSRLAYRRSKRLIKEKVMAKSDFDTAEAALHVSLAKIEQIKAQLDKKFIKAPFSGQLGLRHISLGDYVNNDDPLISLRSIHPIYIDFSVPETYIVQLAKGQTILVSPQDPLHQKYQGKILAFDSSIDPQTRNLTIRGILSNLNNQLKPGSFVEVSVPIGKKRQVISIPQEAIVKSPQQDSVYTVVKNHAVQVPVNVIYRTSTQAFIDKGLSIGDLVIVEGQLKIKNGSIVVAVNSV